MAAEKTTGIVLRVIAFSETSCVVTLFTREFGKITTMAKGARRPKSPFEAALDVLAICRIVFLDKSSGAMGLLTEAKLERRFRSATRNLKQLYAGYYVVELLNTLNDEGDPHPDLFDFAVATICELDSLETREDQIGQILLRFELKALELLGHLPMLTKCVSCGREKTTLNNVSFGLDQGGILCQACRRGESNIVNVSSNGLQYLLDLVGGQIGEKQLNSDNWNRAGRETGGLATREPTAQIGVGANGVGANGEGGNGVGGNQVRENAAIDRNWVGDDAAQHGESNSNSLATKKVDQTREVDQTRGLHEVRHLMQKYITHLLGFQPKLHKYLKNM